MTRLSSSSLAAVSAWLLMPTAVQAALYPGLSNLNHTCSLVKPELSCSRNAVFGKTDSCCSETYGGLILSTQFWSTWTGLESQGQLLPAASWTLHGLWPDFCNGSYPEYCDLTRQYDPTPDTAGVPPHTGASISTYLASFGKHDLIAYLNKYLIAQAQPNPDFWAHEFSKHATCFSTFDTECYGPQYRTHEEIPDFFETAIGFFQQLPTYDWLRSAGIRPSNTTTYTYSKIERALSRPFGAVPFLGCSGPKWNETAAGKGSSDNGRTQLSEVWYYYHAYGATQNVKGKPVETTRATNCAKAKGAVLYPLRGKGSERKD